MKSYALIADRLWDGVSNEARRDVGILIEGSKIRGVLPKRKIPSQLKKIEFKGCTVLPGFIDAHVHYSPVMGPAFLAAGVTTVRDVGNDLDWILRQRAEHADNPSLGPRIVCCGYLLDGSPAFWKRMGRPHADTETLRQSIRHEVGRGVDAIKLYAGLNTEMIRVGVEESHRHHKWVIAHLGAVTAEDAARAGLNEIQHLTGCGAAWKSSTQEEQDKLIDVLLDHQVVMTPTLVVWDRLGRILDFPFRSDSRRQWVHPRHLEIWEHYESRFGPAQGRLKYQEPMAHLKRCLARMSERGVTIAMGTDTPWPHLVPGFSMHDEMAMYVDCGIKPVDALRSATSVGAKVLGLESQVGRVAPGMEADMVIVSGNPLERIEDVTKVQSVLRAGRCFQPGKLLRLVKKSFRRLPEDPVTRDLTSRNMQTTLNNLRASIVLVPSASKKSRG